MSLLVRGGTLVTQDRERRVVEGNLYVEGGRVQEVAGPDRDADRVLEARGCYVLPGLVNGYTRTARVLAGPVRGEEEGTKLDDRMTKRDAGLAAALLLGEQLQQGVTRVLDVTPWPDEVARAVTQIGGKGLVAAHVREESGLRSARSALRALRTWDRVAPLVAVARWEDPELLTQTDALAREEGVRWCLPLAATRRDVYGFQRAHGKRPGEWLEAENLLSPRLLALHGVWLTRNEIRALARGGAGVVHCPVANQMRGAGGPAPLPELLEEGVPVALGTGPPDEVGVLDPFEHLRACAALHRGTRWDPSLLPAPVLLDLVTGLGSAALGAEGGRLEAGVPGDLLILQPEGSPASGRAALAHLAAEGRSAWVRGVVVDGTPVVEDGRLTTVDLASLRAEVETLRRELAAPAGG